LSRNTLILAAAGGSVLLLAGAFAFQAAGYLPCAMCWWQRYPHMAAIAIGAAALATRGPLLPALGALAALSTALIGLFHTGVERNWWEGPASCTGGGLEAGLSGGLLSMEGPRLVMCDQVSWALWGLSMPSWNALLSLALVLPWVLAARHSPAPALTRPA
jgi:disulfide bond formation protein DsbB